MYGVDLGDPDVMVRRSWPWLQTRVVGLLSSDTRLFRALFTPPPVVPPAAS